MSDLSFSFVTFDEDLPSSRRLYIFITDEDVGLEEFVIGVRSIASRFMAIFSRLNSLLTEERTELTNGVVSRLMNRLSDEIRLIVSHQPSVMSRGTKWGQEIGLGDGN